MPEFSGSSTARYKFSQNGYLELMKEGEEREEREEVQVKAGGSKPNGPGLHSSSNAKSQLPRGLIEE